MKKVRGLTTRLCPKCGTITPHRTLYVKTESGGKTKWSRVFWACCQCSSLNHIVLPLYALRSVPPTLPSSLSMRVVGALKARPMDTDELLRVLRLQHITGVQRIFDLEVGMVLTYLKSNGTLTEGKIDRTLPTLEALKERAQESKHLGYCPPEEEKGTLKRSLISLYSERRLSKASRTRVPVGVLCVNCGYYRTIIDAPSESAGLHP